MTVSKWKVDPAHSSVEFSVKHMMITRVKGSFKNFEATLEADPSDLTTADIEFKIDLSSVDSGSADRDTHLKSSDFFDVDQYSHMTFKSTDITKKNDDEYNVTGDLSLHGHTKPVTLTATFEGEGKDPWGNHVAGFSAEGKINRTEFGLTYNAALETGGVLVGEDVKVSLQIEASKEA